MVWIVQSTEEDDRDLLGSQLVGGSVQQQGLARPVVSDDHQGQWSVPSLQDLVQGVHDYHLKIIFFRFTEGFLYKYLTC